MASKRYSIGRTPNINVNTIKKTSWAVNNVPNFTFILLFKTQYSPNFKLQVNTPFNNPYFAKACKNFKPTCSSLICHNLIESPFKFSEVNKISVIALPFKWYKLLRRMPFRITNEPLDILRTPSLRVLLRTYASKDPTEIRFFFSWGTISHLSTLLASHQTT